VRGIAAGRGDHAVASLLGGALGSLRPADIADQVAGGRCPSTGQNKGGRERRVGIYFFKNFKQKLEKL
jgi:hypothetical protein